MTGRAGPGRLIVLEGPDAAGKTTQARLLAEALGTVPTFQFGATAIGSVLRQILLDPDMTVMADRTEALLIIADKAQHVVEVVEPALRSGRDVVSDRFTASTIAYQGHGRGLDIASLESMLHFATGGIQPDLTVLLDVEIHVARKRQNRKLDPMQLSLIRSKLDRIEREDRDFHQRVLKGYRELAASDPHRWVTVDGSSSVEVVAEQVLTAVRHRLEGADR